MPNKGTHSILVIEDNPGDFALVEEFLFEQIEAPVIIQCLTYKEAEATLKSKNVIFDIILLDLSLPDKTGIPLIQDIMAIGFIAPVIVLTGYADLCFGVKSLSLGVSDYLLKDELTALSLYRSIIYNLERKRILLAFEASELRAKNFAKQLNKAIEEERARIAREIHDEFGQQLSGLKMSLSSLKKKSGLTKDVVESLDSLVTDVNISIHSVRQIANELRPVLIDKLGLFAAIEWLTSEFEKKTGVTSTICVDIEQPLINSVAEINLFRICQEALTNIAKHADATSVDVRIGTTDGILAIRIADNGKGIADNTLRNNISMGLVNMQERAHIIGAVFTITSSATEGTIIDLKLNLNGNQDITS
jgi:signal transduction histidine kinase